MSGEGPTSAEEEVVRLRAELARSQEKLQTWKQKTEAGVNQLRQQVIDLTGALTQSRAEIEAVKRAGSVSSSSPQGSGPDAATTTSSSSSVDLTTRYSTYLGLLHSIHSAWWAQKAQIVADASRSISSSDVRGEYESYKRRMVATLKLQAQNTDALQRQVAEKTEELSHLQAEIVKRDKQHSNMVEALNAAEQRVSANHETIQTLRREVAATNGRLNMEEEHAVHDSYEERLQAVLEEQQAREEAIFSQHEDEMQRLRAQHHKEMGVVRTDCERRVAEALEEAARRVGSSSVRKEEVRDESYAQLLSDYEVVKQELEDARAEVAGLKLRVRDSDGRSVDRSEPAQSSTAESRSVGRRSGTEEPRTLKDAVSLIADLRLDLEDAVNQLWECKRELLAVKRGAPRETSATTSATALNDSSFAYLRAIMVKFLCSIDDVRVVVNLLPVLSTLLRLQDDEIKQIYSAHPKWISS